MLLKKLWNERRKPMKKWLLILCSFLLLGGGTALAVPNLQLDISDGVWDPVTQTVFATTDEFTLTTLLKETSKTPLTDTYYLSVAILTSDFAKVTIADFGSFSVGGTVFNSAIPTGWVYGTPGIAVPDPSLPEHGVFPTYFTELPGFNFVGAPKAEEYDTQLLPGELTPYDGVGKYLYYKNWDVNVANLADGYLVHFDFYHFWGDDDSKIEKAPFSHDAGTTTVPEPSTMFLLGVGMIGLVAVGRKRIVK
jgi:hypothetical protein